jgi:hypothetical protein
MAETVIEVSAKQWLRAATVRQSAASNQEAAVARASIRGAVHHQEIFVHTPKPDAPLDLGRCER